VIVDDDTPSEKLTWKAEYEAYRSHRAADVLPMHAETFERYRNIVGTLAAEADADGIRPATDFRVADTFTASPVDRMARRGPTGQGPTRTACSTSANTCRRRLPRLY
jgi:hypothetical protein